MANLTFKVSKKVKKRPNSQKCSYHHIKSLIKKENYTNITTIISKIKTAMYEEKK